MGPPAKFYSSTRSLMGRHLNEITIPLFKVFMAPSVEAAVARVLYSGFVG